MLKYTFVALAVLAAFTFTGGGSSHQVGHHRLCVVLPVPGQFTPALVLQGKDCRPRHHHQEERDDGEA